MHVSQFLNPFLVREHHEIVESRLPDGPAFAAPPKNRSGFLLLRKRASSRRANPCLIACITTDGFPHCGSVDQQMQVLGHHHVSQQHEAVTPAHLLQNFHQ